MGITISPWMMAFLMLMTGFAGFVDSAAGGGGLISLPAYLFAGLCDIHGKLPAVLRFQQLREAAAGIDVHLQRERRLFRRQIGKIGGIEFLFKAARWNFRQQQRLRLGVEGLQQLDDFAQRYAVRHRHIAEISAGNRRQPVIVASVRPAGQGVQQLRHKVVNVDQLQLRRRIVDRNRQVVSDVVTERRHGGIVIRTTPLAEHIGKTVDQCLRAGLGGVGAQPIFAGQLCLAVFAARIAPDERGLRGAGQHHRAAVARTLQGGKQHFQGAGVAGKVFLRRFRAVHACQMEHKISGSRISGKLLRRAVGVIFEDFPDVQLRVGAVLAVADVSERCDEVFPHKAVGTGNENVHQQVPPKSFSFSSRRFMPSRSSRSVLCEV